MRMFHGFIVLQNDQVKLSCQKENEKRNVISVKNHTANTPLPMLEPDYNRIGKWNAQNDHPGEMIEMDANNEIIINFWIVFFFLFPVAVVILSGIPYEEFLTTIPGLVFIFACAWFETVLTIYRFNIWGLRQFFDGLMAN